MKRSLIAVLVLANFGLTGCSSNSNAKKDSLPDRLTLTVRQGKVLTADEKRKLAALFSKTGLVRVLQLAFYAKGTEEWQKDAVKYATEAQKQIVNDLTAHCEIRETGTGDGELVPNSGPQKRDRVNSIQGANCPLRSLFEDQYKITTFTGSSDGVNSSLEVDRETRQSKEILRADLQEKMGMLSFSLNESGHASSRKNSVNSQTYSKISGGGFIELKTSQGALKVALSREMEWLSRRAEGADKSETEAISNLTLHVLDMEATLSIQWTDDQSTLYLNGDKINSTDAVAIFGEFLAYGL